MQKVIFNVNNLKLLPLKVRQNSYRRAAYNVPRAMGSLNAEFACEIVPRAGWRLEKLRE